MKHLSQSEYFELIPTERHEYVNLFIKPDIVKSEYADYIKGMTDEKEANFFLGKVTNKTEDKKGNPICFVHPCDPVTLKEADFFSDINFREESVFLFIGNNENGASLSDEGCWVVVCFNYEKQDKNNSTTKKKNNTIECQDGKFNIVPADVVEEVSNRLGYNKEMQELVNKLNVIREEKEQLENENTRITKENEEKNEILKEAESKLVEAECKRSKLEKEIGEMQSEKALLEKLGFRLPSGESSDCDPAEFDWSYMTAVQELKKKEQEDDLKEKLEHYKLFGSRIMDRFLGASFLRQLIILTGPSGTGKTTLPRVAARLLDGECRVISVQPNWTDSQDLLGFYNFMEQRYISTEFLDALFEANRNPSKKYFIVLDEMNLAHVEYYFAKILSVIELMDDENGTDLQLYSDSVMWELNSLYLDKLRRICSADIRLEEIQKKLRSEDKCPDNLLDYQLSSEESLKDYLNSFVQDNESYKQWLTEYENYRDKVCHFPASVPFPRNVQIVGTINMDATTKGISPKVLDRSYVIEVSDEYTASGDSELYGIYKETEDTSKYIGIGLVREFIDELNNPSDGTLRARFSKRLQTQFERMAVSIFGKTQTEVYPPEFVDDFILSKILPATQSTRRLVDEDSHNKMINSLSSYENQFPNSLKKLGRMYKKDMQTYDYWV